MQLDEKITLTIQKVNRWIDSMAAPNIKIFGVKKPSSFYEQNPFLDMFLPATYNTAHCAILTGHYQSIAEEQKKELIDFLLSFRKEDGYFHMPSMLDSTIVKDTNPFDKAYVREYVNFHVSNYSLGALSSLGHDVSQGLNFLSAYHSLEKLEAWMGKRKWQDPWAEGNFIVNLASFYFMAAQKDEKTHMPLIEYLLDWHNKNQDPATGYWGTDIAGSRDTVEHAMAGAAHNFHLYYYMNRGFKYVDVIVDYCIDYIRAGVRSACLDIDVVDILAHCHVYGYRTKEIESAFEEYAYRLIEFQNADGGFCDVRLGLRRFDSWAGGYWEPQGLSNDFATWFRTATLAMISCILFPETRARWSFRNTIGIGYFNKNYTPKFQ